MTEAKRQQAVRAVQRLDERYEGQYGRWRGWIKSVDGSTHVAGRSGYVYVQRRDVGTSVQLEEVRLPYGNVPDIDGYPIVVGRDSLHRESDVILGRDVDIYNEWLYDYLLQKHADQHIAPDGFDIVWINGRAVLPLRVGPQLTADLSVKVEPGVYPSYVGNEYFDGSTSVSLSANVPNNGQRWVVVGINQRTGAIGQVVGDIVFAGNPLTATALPAFPNHLVVLAAVQLYVGQTEVVEGNLWDLRSFCAWARLPDVYDDGILIVEGANVLSFTGDGVSISAGGNGTAIIEVTGGGGGATTFLALTDTPVNYAGDASKLTRVNAGETALEFTTDLPDHDHTGDVGDGGQLDHGALLGLAGDDHTQYALVDGTRAFTGVVTFNAGITFAGASGVNVITVPDNVANAAHIVDAGGLEYLRVVSTNAQPLLHVNQGGADIDFRVDSAGFAPALFVQGSDGFVGINTVPSYPLHANLETTAVAGNLYTAAVTLTANPGAVSATVTRAMQIGVYVKAANAQNITSSIAGLYGFAFHQGTGTVSKAYGNLYAVYSSAGGTITTSYGIYLETALLHAGGGDTIGTSYGLYIQAPYWVAGKTIGVQYGIYLTNYYSAGTTCYAIYSAGGTVQIHTGGTAVKGLLVTAAAGQTANLQEWRSSPGTALMEVEATGCIDYRWAMGNSTKNPAVVAPNDWVQCKIAGVTRYLPAYAA